MHESRYFTSTCFRGAFVFIPLMVLLGGVLLPSWRASAQPPPASQKLSLTLSQAVEELATREEQVGAGQKALGLAERELELCRTASRTAWPIMWK